MSTRIEWCEETWNPVVGCSAVSPGCAHCYAASVARRAMQPAHAGLVNARGHWTGEVRLLPERLAEPLHWRKPRRVFVCSMSDLFHEDVPDEFIDRVFAIMALTPLTTYQVLTKRADRMLRYIQSRADGKAWTRWILNGPRPARSVCGGVDGAHWLSLARNIWLGVSCEDQQRADERIPLLLRTPAAVRFVSAEPLLGPVDLDASVRSSVPGSLRHHLTGAGLDWVIVGGESGPGARPCDVAWIRSIVEQCRAASVPAFVKQLGARPFQLVSAEGGAQGTEEALARLGERHPQRAWFGRGWTLIHLPDGTSWWRWPSGRLRDRKGGDPNEWPEDLRVREWPE